MVGSHPENPLFDEEFRRDILAAMQMGFPVVVEDQPIFHIPAVVQETGGTDMGGAPWDWGDEPTVLEPARDVTVLCAIEDIKGLGSREGEATPVGYFDTDKVTIYMFREEWLQVKDFTAVSLGQSRYRRMKRLPPIGLYGVQLEAIECEAVDES